MDFIFHLEEGERITFLHQLLIQTFGCTYICVWSYLPQPCNYFIPLDGLFNGDNIVARRLFEEYNHSQPIANDGHVPGLAFRNSLPYLELQFHDLQSLVATPVQLQFYREAGIKTAILMGCSAGEIEVGMSIIPEVNMEMEMRRLMFSPYQPSIPKSKPSSASPSSTSPISDFSLESQQEYTSLLTNDLPSITSKAYLAVISSSLPPPPPSSSSSFHHPLDQPPESFFAPNFQRKTAFERYHITTRINNNAIPMFKRCVTFFRNLNNNVQRRIGHHHHHQVSSIATTSSSSHVIAERRRREKINESLRHLRSLLPVGIKRDKASVLTNTTEYLSTLKAQVEELTKKNQIMEAQLSSSLSLPQKEATATTTASSGGEAVDVNIIAVDGSMPEEAAVRLVDLQVLVRGESSRGMSDMIIRLLEFLNGVDNVRFISLQANTTVIQSTTLNHVVLRLRIEGDAWDMSAFQEAVKGIIILYLKCDLT
ncbi:unnamed protein product [Cuscuta epithymum]|uniref:BHLH domain-containing protein n=1 Tax=Cuscuta epithymum TaxID=186058 RepID=A0AAV0BWP5_9ASTE|nr:unnamed protein product [Cuscuta epithymum]